MSWLNVKSPDAPKVTLVAFDRPHLRVGKAMPMVFTVKAEQMSAWVNSTLTVAPGKELCVLIYI